MPPRQIARIGCWGGSCCEEERMGSTARAEVEERTSGPSSQPGARSPCPTEGPILPLEKFNFLYFQVLAYLAAPITSFFQ